MYTFYLNSDDGSRLWIGDTLLVDNDGFHSTAEKSGSIGLSKGKHAFKVGFFEATGLEVLEVRIEGPNLPKQLVPARMLYYMKSKK